MRRQRPSDALLLDAIVPDWQSAVGGSASDGDDFADDDDNPFLPHPAAATAVSAYPPTTAAPAPSHPAAGSGGGSGGEEGVRDVGTTGGGRRAGSPPSTDPTPRSKGGLSANPPPTAGARGSLSAAAVAETRTPAGKRPLHETPPVTLRQFSSLQVERGSVVALQEGKRRCAFWVNHVLRLALLSLPCAVRISGARTHLPRPAFLRQCVRTCAPLCSRSVTASVQ